MSRPTAPSRRKPNFLVIFGDDIGQANISAYSFGLMGYKTPNIDRIAPLRTGLSKVGIPGATVGRRGPNATARPCRCC
jgi:hypothetical protein